MSGNPDRGMFWPTIDTQAPEVQFFSALIPKGSTALEVVSQAFGGRLQQEGGAGEIRDEQKRLVAHEFVGFVGDEEAEFCVKWRVDPHGQEVTWVIDSDFESIKYACKRMGW